MLLALRSTFPELSRALAKDLAEPCFLPYGVAKIGPKPRDYSDAAALRDLSSTQHFPIRLSNFTSTPKASRVYLLYYDTIQVSTSNLLSILGLNLN